MISGAMFLADGFEEIEAITVIDILRRADVELKTFSINQKIVLGAHKINIESDFLISDFREELFDFIVLPGGMGGTERLMNNPVVIENLQKFNQKKKIISAICAAPLVLDKAKILAGDYVCYPSIEKNIKSANYVNQSNVVHSNNIITSMGPATAMEFALYLVSVLKGADARIQQEKQLLWNRK